MNPSATSLSDLEDMAVATSWMSWALCPDTDPDAFFPPDAAGPAWWADAVRVCAGCPVRDECLDYALRLDIGHGVWGGTTPGEREEFKIVLVA